MKKSRGVLLALPTTSLIALITIADVHMAGAAPPADACTLLSAAQVSAVLGATVGAGKPFSAAGMSSCLWVGPASSANVILTAADTYNSSKRIEEQVAAEKDPDAPLSITPISGLGDEAYYAWMGTHGKLHGRKGNSGVMIEISGDVPPEKARAMEKTLAAEILSKL